MRQIAVVSMAALMASLVGTIALAQPRGGPPVGPDCVAGQFLMFDGASWVCVDLPTGVTGLERVQADSDFDFVATKQVDAECPAGKKVVGGGYLFFFGGPTVPIRTNTPLLDLSAWRVSGTNFGGDEWGVSAVAICADAPDDL